MKYDATIYIGHNVDGTPKHDASDVLAALAAHGIEACTVYEGAGVWRGETEATSIVELCALSADEVEALQASTIPALCVELEQCEIMARISPSNAVFIAADAATDIETA